MSNTVKGAGRRKYVVSQAKHAQRTPLPKGDGSRPTYEQHQKDLKAAAAPMKPASSKAGQLADYAEAQGWEVKRVRTKDGVKTVSASRDTEALVISWSATEAFVDDATYSFGANVARKVRNAAEAYRLLARTPEDAAAASKPRHQFKKAEPQLPRRRKLPFDPKTAEDEEVLKAVVGRRITWYNSHSEDHETGTVPPESMTRTRRVAGEVVQVHIKSRTSISLSQAHGTFGRKILSFCDPELGFRACFVDAIERVR